MRANGGWKWRRGIVLAGLLACLWGWSQAAQAQQNPKDKNKLAYTDPAQADEDFAYQGEFAGFSQPLASGQPAGRYGLQVIALGEGVFDALLLVGGLPGQGWDRAGQVRLNGRLKDGVVSLKAEGDYRIDVQPDLAVAYSPSGTEIGRLPRVKRVSPTMGAAPPAGAVVLFNGSGTEEFQGGKTTPDGLLLAGALTQRKVGAFHMHIEFRTPYMPHARGQARGNSGVYIQQRYEVQVLDSFGLKGEANECGGLYRQTPPDQNLCLPPLAWQTYDIYFTPPQFAADGKTKVANGRLTLYHNGVPVHYQRELISKTGAGKPEGPDPLPINLQDHGNPVAFRNIWLVELQAGSAGTQSVVDTGHGRCRRFHLFGRRRR